MFNHSDYIEANGFPCNVTILGHSSITSPHTWLCLLREVRAKWANGFKVAHIFFNDPSIICPPILKLVGFKVIISRRDMGYWYTPIYLAALRFNSMFLNLAIVNSEAVKTITHEKEHIALEKILVIYNGYEGQGNIESVSNAVDLVRIGMVANVRPIKRIADAIEAVSCLRERGRNIQLTIVGDGDFSNLTKFAAKLGIGDHIIFTGVQSNVKKFIYDFDIALLCSESEGFSNSIIEYMQCGKPVVCSNVGGNPEIVIDDFNGYLYEAGDIEGLVNRLIPLIDSYELRQKLGQNGQLKVQEEYNISTMLDAHNKVYQSLHSF